MTTAQTLEGPEQRQEQKAMTIRPMTRAQIKRALAAAERQEQYRLMVEFAGKGKGGPSIKFGFCWCLACRRKIHPGKHRKHARHCDMVRAYQDLHGIVRKGQGIE